MIDLEYKSGPLLLVPVGLPGSGKTSWAQAIAWDFPGVIVVSADKIRQELFGSLDKAHSHDEKEDIGKKHKKVFDIFYQEIEDHLSSGKKVIADASNVKCFARLNLVEIAKKRGAEVRAVVFASGFDLSLAPGPAPSEKTIENMADHFNHAISNIEAEGFHQVVWQR